MGETWSGSVLSVNGSEDTPEVDSKIRNICTEHEYGAARALKEALGQWLRSREADTAE
jgi:hypothetical protein